MSSPAGTGHNAILPIVVAAMFIVVAIASVAGTYVVTRNYEVAHPVLSTVVSMSTVSLTQSETSYITMTSTQVSLQTVNVNYGYEYGYGQGCYPPGCTTNTYVPNQAIQCMDSFAYRWLQSGQTCIAGTLSYQGSCLLLYDYYVGATYVLLGYGGLAPNGTYAIAVGYVLKLGYTSTPCAGIPFQVSFFLPTG